MREREITGRRLGPLLVGKCCECGSDQWQPGPQGGMSQNFECAGCRRRFNIVIIGRTVLFANEIPRADNEHDDWERYRREYPVGSMFRERGH